MAKLRLGLAQINPTVGNLADNTAVISRVYVEAAAAGCDVVAFPELAITGYPPEDLVLKPGFIVDNRRALDMLVASTGSTTLVVGFVDHAEMTVNGVAERLLFNAAAVARDGKLLGIYRKQLLPNYSVFDEERYFVPGPEDQPTFDVAGQRVAISICEDLWAEGPVAQQAEQGAQLIISINGSPFHREKPEVRRDLVAGRARDNKVVVAYVNQVGGQDELVFDGGSLIADARGLIAAQSPFFVDDLLVVDISNDGSVSPVATADDAEDDELARVYDALVLGTRDYVRKNGFTDVVLGLSGGIDSALVAAVAVDALGAEHVHGVSMPSRYSSEGSITDATTLATNLGIDLRLIPIEPAFGAYLDMLAESFAGKPADLTEENLQSRVRGTVVMALSNKHGWMVLTTGNKSEMAVGYFTLYGDSVGGYAVIKDVFKLTVYDLCHHVNRRAGREIIPREIIDKPPSAELRPDQRDDQSLPAYDVLDPILEMYVEDDMTAADIIALGHDEALVRRIARLVDMNEYKRRQCPPGVRISTKAFGKDRRLPITNAYRG
ncbi:MAG: NAD+ synthase [Actinobacteria bacterium]|nr:NAD+ synthase [Actinomycetota bacterium]NBP53125.1 NAD+ synthase [Actinomycetota bacterium]